MTGIAKTIGGLLLLCVGMYVVLGILENRSLERADYLYLGATYERWREAGQPDGDKLKDFLQGRRADLIFYNQTFVLHGTNYLGEFAFTKPWKSDSGYLVITTNKILLWSGGDGKARLASFQFPK
ncbi:MAG: hypothetical protein ABIQ35_06140 [Verrucomicrobiota bacterium]